MCVGLKKSNQIIANKAKRLIRNRNLSGNKFSSINHIDKQNDSCSYLDQEVPHTDRSATRQIKSAMNKLNNKSGWSQMSSYTNREKSPGVTPAANSYRMQR